MVEQEAVFLEPSNISQKLSRHTKGIMISLGILVVSASLATVGTVIDEWITMTLGYVVAGISSVSYLVFFILFIASVKKFGRIEKELIGVTNKIFASFLFAFFFTLAGFAAIYGEIMSGDPSFYISRIYGFLALFFYITLFLSVDKLFKELNALNHFPREKRRKKYFVLILSIVFLVEVVDTILRPILFKSFSSKSEEWFITFINRPMTWVILVFLIISVGFICYELHKLSNDWLDIDDEINQKFFQIPLKSFDDKFRNNNFMFYLSFAMSIFLSIFYVLGYIILSMIETDYSRRWISRSGFNQFGFSVGPFVGLSIVIAIYYLIRIVFRYQKVSQLSRETSTYGIIISISITLSPFILLAGFFFNVTYDIKDDQLFLISRILMSVGILLFSLGTYFNTRSLDGLKDEEKGDRSIKQRIRDLLVPLSGLSVILLIIIDTIIRMVLWNVYDTSTDYLIRRANWYEYVGETVWTGWIFLVAFTIVLVALIYGFRRTEKDILDILPKYGIIPVKVKKAKVVVQPTVVAKPVAEPVEKPVKTVIKPKIGHCSSCGEKIDERFRFCPSCGVQEVGKEAVPKGKFCANCGDTIEKQFRFCPSCGVQFG